MQAKQAQAALGGDGKAGGDNPLAGMVSSHPQQSTLNVEGTAFMLLQGSFSRLSRLSW